MMILDFCQTLSIATHALGAPLCATHLTRFRMPLLDQANWNRPGGERRQLQLDLGPVTNFAPYRNANRAPSQLERIQFVGQFLSVSTRLEKLIMMMSREWKNSALARGRAWKHDRSMLEPIIMSRLT